MFSVFNLCKKFVWMSRKCLLFIRGMVLVFSGIVVPNQAKRFQLLDACSIKCGRLGGNELSVLSSLTLDPCRKLRTSLVGAWNEAVSVKHLEFLQFHEFVVPSGKVRVPNETNLVQLLDAFKREVGVFTHRSKLVLVTLAFDPLEQGGVDLVVDVEVALTLVEFDEFLEAIHPSLVLEGVVSPTAGRSIR